MADEPTPALQTETPQATETAPAPSGGPTSPTPDAPAEGQQAPAASPAQVEAKPDAAPQKRDWRATLDELDPQDWSEVRKHPKMAGLVGSLLEAERHRARQEAEQTVRAREQDERLRQLRKEDPEAYVREVEQQEQAQARAGQVMSGIHARIATWAATLPPEVQQKTSGKTYPGSYEDGVLAYTREVADLLVEHRVAEAVARERQKWEKDVRPAIKAEVLAEINGGEPAPDTRGGAAPTTNGFKVPATMAEINRLPNKVYKQHMTEIEAAVLSGRVK